ncbi:MAG: LLM class flavin-dependent oxidoreductase, partial [Actinobacteria bacterium]|nr:LLM class flavin-dependent oxidoreductase [Actinomycetota bacterium]
AIVDGLWRTPVGETFSFAGEHWSLQDSPALPKPVQDGGVPIIIGGRGAKRTPALTAKYAAEFNMPFCEIEQFSAQTANVRRACESVGRDPSSLIYSVALVVCVGGDEAEYVRRAAAIGREPDELRANGVAGTPDEVRATLARWRAAGAERIYLQMLDLSDLDHLDLVADIISS